MPWIDETRVIDEDIVKADLHSSTRQLIQMFQCSQSCLNDTLHRIGMLSKRTIRRSSIDL